jgi:hypothetical protein
MRTIGIVGRYFCGSTILGRLMNLLPGVVSVGEVRHLLLGKKFWTCTACAGIMQDRGPCRELMKIKAPLTPKNLYAKVAAAHGTDILVPGDKQPKFYEQATEPGTMDAIVLFKSPLAFAASDLRPHPEHVDQNGNPIFPPIGVNKSMRRFREFYEPLLEWEHPRRTIYIGLEAFIASYPYSMGFLARMLDLPAPTRFPKFKNIPHHNVLGNHKANQADKLWVDMRWEQELTPRQRHLVLDNEDTWMLYRRLMGRMGL